MGRAGPHLAHGSMGSHEFTTQMSSRSVQLFLHSSRQSVVGHARTCPFPLKSHIRMARSGPPSNTRFLWPTRVHIPNIISIGSAVFAQLTAERPYTVQWAVPSLLKISHSHGVSGPHLIYFPWTHPNAHPGRHLDRFSRFAGLTSVTDRQTTLLDL